MTSTSEHDVATRKTWTVCRIVLIGMAVAIVYHGFAGLVLHLPFSAGLFCLGWSRLAFLDGPRRLLASGTTCFATHPLLLFITAPTGTMRDDRFYATLVGLPLVPKGDGWGTHWITLGAVLNPLIMTVMMVTIIWSGMRTPARAAVTEGLPA